MPEIITTKAENLSWYNADLRDLEIDTDTEIVVFDSYTYGMRYLHQSCFNDFPVIILDSYNEKIFISNLVENKERAYLLIDDFIDELPQAVEKLLKGDNYITSKLLCEL